MLRAYYALVATQVAACVGIIVLGFMFDGADCAKPWATWLKTMGIGNITAAILVTVEMWFNKKAGALTCLTGVAIFGGLILGSVWVLLEDEPADPDCRALYNTTSSYTLFAFVMLALQNIWLGVAARDARARHPEPDEDAESDTAVLIV